MPTMLLLDDSAADGGLPAPLPLPGSAGPPPDRPRARVLVAEDDGLVRGMLERMLLELGYEVRTARHGQEALDLALGDGVPFDLVITDVRMPRMGGPELGRQLEQRWPGIPVLYISGYDVETSAEADTSHRRQAFLRKPFDPGDLAREVASLLGEA